MKFVMFRGQNGHWYWHLQSANNEIVAASGQGYHNRDDCLHGIGLVMDTNRSTPVYQR